MRRSLDEIYPWFAWTVEDLVLQVVGGTISTLSSALIIYIILRSSEKLTSTYHRIMTLFSMFDIFWSFSLALATTPAPKTFIPFKGASLGSQGSCVAQGFFVSMGCGGAVYMSVCLAWYYALVALKVQKRVIRNYYETIFYLFTIALNLWSTIDLVLKKQMNIRFWSNYCGVSPLSSSCFSYEGPDADATCIWPDPPHIFFESRKVWKWTLIVSLILIGLAMLIVIVVIFRNEKKTNMATQSPIPPAQDNTSQQQKSIQLKQTRLIASQAIMYILAFVLSWIMVIITLEMELMPRHTGKKEILEMSLSFFSNSLFS